MERFTWKTIDITIIIICIIYIISMADLSASELPLTTIAIPSNDDLTAFHNIYGSTAVT